MDDRFMVYAEDRKLFTTSLKVAEYFEKEHFHVLRDIRELHCSEKFTALNFAASTYIDEMNREQLMYVMTRNGWIFLVMGYTGEKAAQIKEAYISAFDKMEFTLNCLSVRQMANANDYNCSFQETPYELLKKWLEVYTEPLEKKGDMVLRFDFLHKLFNGWLITNRHKKVSKRDLQVCMELLGHERKKIRSTPAYELTIKKEYR